MRGALIKFLKCVPLAAMATLLLAQSVPVMAQNQTSMADVNAALAEVEKDPCMRQLSQSMQSMYSDGTPATSNDPRMRPHIVAFGQCMGLPASELESYYSIFADQLRLIHSQMAELKRQPQSEGQKLESKTSALQSKDLLTAGQKPKSDDEILAKCAEVARKNAKVALQNPFAEGLEKRIEAVKNIHKDCTEMAMDEVGKQMDSFGKEEDRSSNASIRSALKNSGAQSSTGQSIERTVLMPDGKRYPKASGENPFKALLDTPPPKEKTMMEKTKEGLSNAYSNVKAKLSGPAPAEADDDKPYEDTAPKKSVLQRMRDAVPNPFAPSKLNTVEDDDGPPPAPKKSWSLPDMFKRKVDEAADKIERAGEDDPESQD